MNNHDALQQAIRLTEDILKLIEQDHLEVIPSVDRQRQKLIQKMFEPALKELDEIKIRHLNNLNEQVVDKLSTLKQKLVKQNQEHKQLGRAAIAYQSNR